jgi:hypothetical protein
MGALLAGVAAAAASGAGKGERGSSGAAALPAPPPPATRPIGLPPSESDVALREAPAPRESAA